MKKVKNYYSYIHVSLCAVTVLSMSSCSVVKETAFEAIADTITDPKTGTMSLRESMTQNLIKSIWEKL